MSTSLTVVKLGGAAITHKALSRVVNTQALDACAEAISRAAATTRDDGAINKIAIVHGAGCFGHAEAKQYKIGRSCDPSALGAALTRQAVLELSSLVVESLVDRGVAATPLSSCSLLEPSHVETGSLTEQGEERIARAVLDSINAGFIPVLHGDVVLDSASAFSVLSGDDVVLALARRARAKRAIFVTNVDGVYDKYPEHPKARHIPLVRATDDENPVDSSSRDATGGMKAKLDAAIGAAKAGVPVAILKPETLSAALSQTTFWNHDDHKKRPLSTLIVP